MTSFTLTPALTDAVMARYEADFGFHYGRDDVAAFWNTVVDDGFDGTLDDLVACVAEDMLCIV